MGYLKYYLVRYSENGTEYDANIKIGSKCANEMASTENRGGTTKVTTSTTQKVRRAIKGDTSLQSEVSEVNKSKRMIPAIYSFILPNEEDYNMVNDEEPVTMNIPDFAEFYLMDDDFNVVEGMECLFKFAIEYK